MSKCANREEEAFKNILENTFCEGGIVVKFNINYVDTETYETREIDAIAVDNKNKLAMIFELKGRTSDKRVRKKLNKSYRQLHSLFINIIKEVKANDYWRNSGLSIDGEYKIVFVSVLYKCNNELTTAKIASTDYYIENKKITEDLRKRGCFKLIALELGSIIDILTYSSEKNILFKQFFDLLVSIYSKNDIMEFGAVASVVYRVLADTKYNSKSAYVFIVDANAIGGIIEKGEFKHNRDTFILHTTEIPYNMLLNNGYSYLLTRNAKLRLVEELSLKYVFEDTVDQFSGLSTMYFNLHKNVQYRGIIAVDGYARSISMEVLNKLLEKFYRLSK